MPGFAPEAWRFLFFTAVVLLTNAAMWLYFQLLAVACATDTEAQNIAAFSTLVLATLAGFMIPLAQVKSWFLWLYYLSPISYAFRALSVCEFSSPSYGGLGSHYLEFVGFDANSNWEGYGVLYLAGFSMVMLVLFTLAIRMIRWPEKFAAVAPGSGAPSPPSPSPRGSHVVPVGSLTAGPSTLHPQLQRDTRAATVTLAFRDLCYKVDGPGQHHEYGLTLLQGINGIARPGTVTALMGSSGAGKTTLLDVLAFRKNTGQVSGEILLNGHPTDKATIGRITGYIEQMDVHSPASTVVEALRFSARLRLPRLTPDSVVEETVQRVLDLLELRPLATQLIGTKGAGLSVEQAKRVTIGVELVTNPAILFLDEPTSGLDSRAALVVMK
eukprot:RCo025388